VNAEIIAIGSELLTPFRQDTNSLYLTDKLNQLGVQVVIKTIVGDSRERLVSVAQHALFRSDLVIFMGGLGPTEDDLTREAVAEAWGRPLTMNVSMPIAAVLLDLGFGSATVKSVPLLARTAGLLAHLAEERLRPVGFAMAATLYEPAFAVVVSWFARGRDRALLTVTLVAGLASTIFMPIEAALLERLGWRSALTVLAVVLGLITIPIHALLLRQGTAHASAAVDATAASLSLGQAARTAVFWVLSVAFLVSNFATAAVTTHLIPFLVDRGYAAATAAAVIGWTGAMQLAGRVLFVPISARLGARVMVAAVFVAQALGIAQLPLLARVGTLVPFIVLQGAANGMATLARATSLAEIFGARNYGAISGAVALGANGARAVGPVGASLLLLGLGSYPAVFWALAASLVAAGGAVLFADRSTRAGD